MVSTSTKKNMSAELLGSLLDGNPDYGSDEDTPIESDMDDQEFFSEDVPHMVLSLDDNDVPQPQLAEDSDSDDEDDVPLSSLQKHDAARQWEKREVDTVLPEFIENSGFCNKEKFADCLTPTDAFLMYFDAGIREQIVYQTNLYAVQKGKHFQPLTERDLLGFVGINFFMGYHHLPSYRNYWSTDPDLHIGVVAEIMPRNCFGDILSNLHRNDNLQIPKENKDRHFKTRPLIYGMNERFAMLFDMDRKQSIDESIILFKGRSSLN